MQTNLCSAASTRTPPAKGSQLSMQTNLCSAASTRTPPAKGSQRTINLRTKARSKRNDRFAQRRIGRFSHFHIRGLFSTVHRGQYGTALTPGGRCLRPHRQTGITSNRSCTVHFTFVSCHRKPISTLLRALRKTGCSSKERLYQINGATPPTTKKAGSSEKSLPQNVT